MIGLLSGLIYAIASGAGLPLATKVVIPALFKSEKAPAAAEVKQQVSGQLGSWLSGLQSWVENLAQHVLGDLTKQQLLLLACLWLPVIFLIRSIAGYVNTYLVNFVGFRVLEMVRVDVFKKLQSLPLSFYNKNKSGDLLARLVGDTEVLRQVIAQGSSDIIKQPATLIASLGYVIYESLHDKSLFFALIAMLSVPICIFVIRFAGKKMAKRAEQMQHQVGDLSAMLAESLQAPMEIRAYNLQEAQTKSFSQKVGELLRLSMKVVKYRQIIPPSVEFVAASGFTAAMYVGAQKGMTLEAFMALAIALYMSYEPIKKLGSLHALMKQGEAAINRLEYILHEDDKIDEPKAPKKLESSKGDLEFRNVSFAYNDQTVLQNVSLRVARGEIIGLVGYSGSGKTTFANLIPRFYDPVSGSICIKDIDIRDYLKADLREHIAIVPQQATLFTGTIADNIQLGKPGASREQIEAAAKFANAHDFILAQEKGYETIVGERGTSLSGGQRQRIAIARAFLKDAPILILDEATSALDSESELKIQGALDTLLAGRTAFIIAHNFNTLTKCTRILLFDKVDGIGKIVADGSYDELMETSELFRKLARKQ